MDNNLYRTHGLSGRRYKETHARLFAEQQGLCAVCQKAIGDNWRWGSKITHLAIDHSHITGEIRGLLCGQCNTHVDNAEKGYHERVKRMGQPVPDYHEKIMTYLEKFIEKAQIVCPHCQEQITVFLRDGQPDPRQVPHCYSCSRCRQIKWTAEGYSRIRSLRDGSGWYFICHECRTARSDS